MNINEINTTIHGEAPFIGYPCTLIRLCGCNLKCFYCDTKHEDVNYKLTPEELYFEVEERGLNHILLTGGEPLLQLEEVKQFLDILYQNMGGSYRVVIETNGTQPIDRMNFEWGQMVYIAMDIKPLPITTSEEFALSIANAEYLIRSDVVKLIFWDSDSFDFQYQIADQLQTRAKILFSPVWSFAKAEPMKPYVEKIIELQKKYRDMQFIFQLQLHKALGVV